MYREIIFIYFLCGWYLSTAQSNCRSKKGDGIVCCSGYIWNTKAKECQGCGPGFFGINCSEKCPYPHYGDRCRYRCHCPQEICNNTNGCWKGSSTLHGEVLKYSVKTTITLREKQTQELTVFNKDVATVTYMYMERFNKSAFAKTKREECLHGELLIATCTLCCIVVIYIMIRVIITAYQKAKNTKKKKKHQFDTRLF
ncbi:uncharacterized protein LOC134233135 [Saccostrea cucullata]|uniref:uncharacterized protein LOC134233135 n=1 Tax=Saccostrea cuccullata TaxID=36930 RepID=UPI002ED2465F